MSTRMSDEEFSRRNREDFKFSALCAAKGRSYAFYEMLCDKELIEERKLRAEEKKAAAKKGAV